MILRGFVVDRVVPQFEQLILHLGLSGGTVISILGYIVLEPARLLELYDAEDLSQLKKCSM